MFHGFIVQKKPGASAGSVLENAIRMECALPVRPTSFGRASASRTADKMVRMVGSVHGLHSATEAGTAQGGTVTRDPAVR
jgi:hypothetical protein